MSLEVIGVLVLVLGTVLGMGLMVWLRRRRQAVDTRALHEAKAEGRDTPPTLHPVVDPNLCIGSLSCLAVCPEGDILGVVDGKAALIDASACIGHGKCALECPLGAITLVMGTAKRGIDLPELSETFETSRAGVHIVGELGGMGLIKNAITQGVELAEHFGQSLETATDTGAADVAVVGAGPAGLALGLGLRRAGLSFRVLEQESVGGTIAHYPRQKLVMTERVDLPLYGKFGRAELSKEELLEEFERAIAKGGLEVEVGTRVERIEGSDGAFTLHTSQGPVRARKVALAVGRRGTPRKLEVPGGDLPKVAYELIDTRQYAGSRVLVVGGGDSALEAALQLADETDAEVSLSYRAPEPAKARDANKRRFRELMGKGRITAYMPSTVQGMTEDTVELELAGELKSVPNDYVIACLGGELPTAWLKANDISMRRLHGESLAQPAKPGAVTRADREQRRHRRLGLALFALGALIVAALAVVGHEYYRLPLEARVSHPAHAFLRPAGPWGHGVGIVATLFMLSNFLYVVRKRWARLKGVSTIRTWLTFHQFVGFMSPLVIGFHAAFQSNNALATITTVSLATVVATGVVGRFIFGFVPSGQGQLGALDNLARRYAELKASAEATLEGTVSDLVEVGDVLRHATATSVDHSLLAFLVHQPWRRLQDFLDLRRIRRVFVQEAYFDEFAETFRALRVLQAQVTFYRGLKRLMGVWRVMHVVLAVALVVLIATHIGVSLFLGYKSIFD